MKLDIFKSKLTKQVSELLSGNAIAAAITFVTAPIIAWLFDPNDFGLGSMIIAVASLLLPLSVGGLDKAIQMKSDPVERQSLVAATILLSIVCAAIFLVIALIALWATGVKIELSIALLTFITLLLLAVKEITKANSLAQMRYVLLSRGEVYQAISRTVLRIVSGIVAGSSVFGMAISHQFGLLVMIISIARDDIFKRRVNNSDWSAASAYRQILAHKLFPKYNMTTAFLAQMTRNLPVLILGLAYDPFAAGIYAMADRLVTTPIDLAGNSLRQVLVQRFLSLNSPKESLRLVRKIISVLSFSTGPMAVVFYIYGPDIIEIVLDEKWSKSGEVVRIIAPLLFFKPLFSIFHALALSGRLQKIWFSQESWTFVSRMALVPLALSNLITINTFLTAYVWFFVCAKIIGCWKITNLLRKGQEIRRTTSDS